MLVYAGEGAVIELTQVELGDIRSMCSDSGQNNVDPYHLSPVAPVQGEITGGVAQERCRAAI